MIRRLLYFIAAAGGVLVMAMPTTALADDVFDNVCDAGNASTSAVCTDRTDSVEPEDNPVSGTNGLLYKITLIVSYIAGAAAVILILYGGIRYVASSGDSNSITNAKNTIINAIVGLIIIAIAGALISFVVKRL
jgi:hypothetical protein